MSKSKNRSTSIQAAAAALQAAADAARAAADAIEGYQTEAAKSALAASLAAIAAAEAAAVGDLARYQEAQERHLIQMANVEVELEASELALE